MNDLKQTVCEKRTYSTVVETHSHSYGQLLFPLQGSMNLQTPSQNLQLQTGRCLYLPPTCSHSFHSQGDNQFLVLDIPQVYMPAGPEGRVQAAVCMQMDDQWRALSDLLLQEAASPSSSTALIHLIHYVCGKLPIVSYTSIEYIHQHYMEELTIESLASLEHYHPNYYAAWFKKTTGVTPSSYILDLRMKAAKLLLRNTSRSISYISQEVGYEYAASFTKIFTRYEGVTPQNYRKSLIQDKNKL
ncbi:AraC family transcriptional regulator [Paenibacillus sp. BR2-3]|uniref:AraC family transcriptional regulator n=1 Tax=Paenibacillus sp. BR2-3 TaxID=3048494 RepID=UPI00397730FB